MECDICCRNHTSDLDFLCVACARSSVYATRLESAKVLLAKEQLALKVEHVVSPGPNQGRNDGSQSLWKVEAEKVEKRDTDIRAKETLEHTRILREELEQAKKDIATRRAHLATRKADLVAVTARVPEQRGQRTTKVAESTKRGNQSFDALHDRSIETRAFLCREAAVLLGLKHRKRSKGGNLVDQYYLGGLPITDLKETYNTRCTELNTVIAGVAHLLTLVSFYLCVRLPNEITLPYRDSPIPTILKAEDSYQSRKGLSSINTAAKSRNSSPSASRHEDAHTARPRPLHVGSGERDERLSHIFNNDPAAFALFSEGASLLALNVAWLCKSQGLSSGTETWEDVCNMGKNLWQLLLAPTPSLRDSRELANGRLKQHKKALGIPSVASKPLLRLGQGSQSSAHSFLGSTGSLDREFRLPALVLMTGGLKKALYADINNAEWELLQEEEWDDGTEQFDEAVHIRTRAMDGHEFDDARSIMTTRTRLGDDDKTPAIPSEATEGVKSAKTAGTSGWTKVKSRDK